jgi:hypothetical protein
VQVGKLQEQIDKATARIAEIKAILDARGNTRGVVSPEVQASRDKIAQLRAEFDTVLVRAGGRAAVAVGGRLTHGWVGGRGCGRGEAHAPQPACSVSSTTALQPVQPERARASADFPVLPPCPQTRHPPDSSRSAA